MNNLTATRASRAAHDRLHAMRRQMETLGSYEHARDYLKAKRAADDAVTDLRSRITVVVDNG